MFSLKDNWNIGALYLTLGRRINALDQTYTIIYMYRVVYVVVAVSFIH